MDNIYQICHRMIYIFNATQEPPGSLNPDDYPTNIIMLRKAIDHIVNHMNFQDLPDTLKKVWIEDKISYVTWIRDYLIEHQVNTLF